MITGINWRLIFFPFGQTWTCEKIKQIKKKKKISDQVNKEKQPSGDMFAGCSAPDAKSRDQPGGLHQAVPKHGMI